MVMSHSQGLKGGTTKEAFQEQGFFLCERGASVGAGFWLF